MRALRLSLCLLLCLPVLAFAQGTGTIRGFVYQEASGEPVIFTNVVLEGTTMGAATDENGFFSIANVPVGGHTVLVTNIEYDTLREGVTVEKNGLIVNLRLFMAKSDIKLQTVTVKGQTQEKFEEVRISTIAVTPKQITKLPSVGGEPDLAQYLQVLPGVIFTGDQGGQLYIRGGAPIHNMVLLDGMVIYNPFHSIGLFSVFETDIIRNVEVLTGGFNATYGNRISAVVDVTTRDGNQTGYHGKISASPFLAKATLEGPIKKLSAAGGGSSSFILSAKHSYLDRTSQTVYPWVNDGVGIPFGFTDLYGKISLNSGSGTKFNLFGFNFRDSVNFDGVTSYNWDSWGMGTNFVVVPGGTNVLIEGIFAYSDYKMAFREADEKPRTSQVNGFNLGVDFTYFVPDGDVNFGFQIQGFETDFRFFNAIGTQYEQNQFTTELGAFVKYRKVFNRKFVLEPSLRIQYYSSLGTLSPEPRLGLKYNAAERFRLKFAGGFYSQNLIDTRSDRDVVNLFTGFLSGPDGGLETPDGEDANDRLQRAWHAIGGVEIDATDYLELGVEPYIKRFTQLININRQKIFPSDPDFATETGDAYGVDFLAKYERARWYAWLAYSLSRVTRYDGNQTYPPHYDRRHNVNAILSYLAGKDQNIELSVRWNLGSGFPFTQTAGFYENIGFLDGIGTDYTTQNGDLGILYDDENLNGGRLPYYHRLDLSAKYTASFLNDTKLEVSAGVTNAYDRRNIFYFDRVRAERVDQLPILPSLALSYAF
jgi:hypothetical protein